MVFSHLWHGMHGMNHFFFSEKNKLNKKRKLVTLQKCKESKKRANYSIHTFWKQDLSGDNYLPNFSDDLNVHKNSNISKFSTVNITADNFFSLDNNFLKLNGSEPPLISKSSNSDSISVSTSINKAIPKDFTVSRNKILFSRQGIFK